ncbi:MAG: phosphatase PAP2-related protein [Ignavibacteria bacterium]
MTNSWENFLNNKRYTVVLITSIILLLVLLTIFAKFLVFVENRQGVVLEDPIMKMFTALDLNIPIFIVIYGSLISGLIILVRSPKNLLIGIQTYLLMLVFRIVGMYITPLDIPLGSINLQDPLVFVLGTGQIITKDLFFSGHTATLFIIFLVMNNRKLKLLYLFLSITVAIMIYLQKAHYLLDILVAPFVSYASYRIIINLDKLILKQQVSVQK